MESSKRYFSNLYLYLLIFLLMIFSVIVGSNYSLPEFFIYFILMLFAIPIIFFKKINIKFEKKDIVMFFLFAVIGCLSSISNSEFTLLFSSVFFIIFYIVSKYFVSYIFVIKDFKRILLKENSIFLAIFLIFIFLYFNDGRVPYKGIYENPNTMGGILATSIILMLGLIFGVLDKWRKSNIIFFITLNLLSLIIFYQLLQTSSRTSLIAVLSVLFFLILIFSLRKIYERKYSTVLNILIFNIVLFLWIKSYSISLFDNFLLKFSDKNRNNDVFDGRTYIWDRTLSDAGLFGGSDYFIREFSLGAHSSFISIIGRFGYIFGGIIILCWMYLGYKAISYFFKCKNDFYSYCYLALWLGFTILSITEVMLYKTIMLLFFLCISGFLIENNSVRT